MKQVNDKRTKKQKAELQKWLKIMIKKYRPALERLRDK